MGIKRSIKPIMEKLVLSILLVSCVRAQLPFGEHKDDKIFDSKNADLFGSESLKLCVFDDDGNKVPLDLMAEFEESEEETEKEMPNRVVFNLYTKDSKEPEILTIDDSSALQKTAFDSKLPTVMITHGWMNSQNNPSCTAIRDAYLQHGECNVIVMDWSKVSMKEFMWVRKQVQRVGKHMSAMMNFLGEQGMDAANLTVVGHSLGAHVVGLASYYAKNKAKYVVGLDATLPTFEKDGPGQRIAQGDGEHVLIIHTTAGTWGYVDAIGDADFYPNGGVKQEGCSLDELSVCSHFRAPAYFAESINSETGFWGVQCGSYGEYKDGQCKSNPTALMGGFKPDSDAKGTFYLDTASTPPYAQGPISSGR